ncbi:MAG: NnrS family protein [Tateyamaria sp.]|uniref:NnrS family protein n=1 Tax=Tateyamaria sp. TaxID=1929288 RepID=UPI0032720934
MTSNAQIDPKPLPVPAFLSIGLRPFFLLGAVWAALAMIVWILALTGRLDLSSRFDPISWHAHAFLFGYLGAIIAGFLLTAVPNWTGRPPLRGWPLLGLVLLWAFGRGAVATSALWPMGLVIAIDLSFPVILGAVILREVILGQNWRNMIIMGMLAAFTLANLIFHIEAATGAYAAQGLGLRLGLAAAVLMITVMGGRIIPTFTGNWFKKTRQDVALASPMQRFDKIVVVATVITLTLWVVSPDLVLTGGALLILAGLHAVRLARWKGHYTAAEPLVFVLHAGYAFLPLGALTLRVGLLWPDHLGLAAAQHIWMAGAIGVMTLAVMTRATLGHTGQNLHAGGGTVVIYAAIVLSVLTRLGSGIWPLQAGLLFPLSGALWIVAFGGFAFLYSGLLARPRT